VRTTNYRHNSGQEADEQLPGVDVELEKGKGLEVKTPGTDVTVNQEGVNVTAPIVEFEAKAKKGE
jgi:hypothetical protein